MQQQWLFVSATGQQFTANEPDVPALVQSGQISAQTLMWREGMPQWMPAASVFPILFSASSAVTQPMVGGPASGAAARAAAATAAPAPATSGRPASPTATSALGEAAIRRLAGPLIERKGWIKLLGVLCIIGGIFSLPALLIGLLPIFAGVSLMKMAGHLERVQAGGDFAQLEEVQRNAAKFFFFQGIFVSIYLAFIVLVIGLGLIGGGAAAFRAKQLETMAPGTGGPTLEDIRMPDGPPVRQGQ